MNKLVLALILLSFGCEEKDPQWPNKMASEWADVLGFKTTRSECITYTSNWAKCSVRVNDGNVYSIECIRHRNKCVGIGQ